MISVEEADERLQLFETRFSFFSLISHKEHAPPGRWRTTLKFFESRRSDPQFEGMDQYSQQFKEQISLSQSIQLRVEEIKKFEKILHDLRNEGSGTSAVLMKEERLKAPSVTQVKQLQREIHTCKVLLRNEKNKVDENGKLY